MEAVIQGQEAHTSYTEKLAMPNLKYKMNTAHLLSLCAVLGLLLLGKNHKGKVGENPSDTTVSSSIVSREKSRFSPLYYSYRISPYEKYGVFPKTPYFSFNRPSTP